MKKADVLQMNVLALAYIGDAAYELHVRNHLLESGQVKVNELHQRAITFVSGQAQAAIVRSWLEESFLTEEEERVVKRGRNAKSTSVPKNLDVQSYRYSTGFETIIGYHFLLKNEERLQQLLEASIRFIELKEQD